jgi:hypothetical protein
MDSDQPPHWSRRLLQLPLDFDSSPSKRHRVIGHGTHTSTIQTCDSTRMSTEPSLQNTRSTLTPTPTIVNGTSPTPATSMVVVSKAHIITMARSTVNSQATTLKPFGSLGHSPGYNVYSIPMAFSPFSYGMANLTSEFSNSILVLGLNDIIGLWGTTPPYIYFSFVGSQIPQTNPNMGGFPMFNLGSNPPPSGWNNQHGGQASSQVPSYNPTSSV